MLSQISHTIMAQAAMDSPNWVTIGIIVGVMVVIGVILLLIPNGNYDAISSDEKKGRKAIEDKSRKSGKKALGDGEQLDKEKMSLAEIKEAKRASVGEDTSKAEMRELRKERRAATQTANAVHEREEKDDKKSGDNAGIDAGNADGSKASTKPNAADIFAVDDMIANADTDTGDVFASLFGGDASELSFDDVMDVPKPADGMVFPSLGSALIPLEELTREADADGGLDTLSELTKRFDNSSEKKTP